MRKMIEVTQDLQRHAPGNFSVVVTTIEDSVELSKEYTYHMANKVSAL